MNDGDDRAGVNGSDIPDEEVMRAQVYGLLARLLAAPPGAEDLAALTDVEGDRSPLGQALNAIAEAARAAEPKAVEHEYNALFIGVSGGELTPYGSYYLTGFLNEKPLAELRGEMARLGIARAQDVREPEDHIASLCEMMAGLIVGAFGAPLDLAEQRRFYDRHIGSWAPRFFADLEKAENADFYRPVGAFGRRFLEVEGQAFDLAA